MSSIESVAAEAEYSVAKEWVIEGRVRPCPHALRSHLGIDARTAHKYVFRMVEENILVPAGDYLRRRLSSMGVRFGEYTITFYGEKLPDKIWIRKGRAEGGQFDVALIQQTLDEIYSKRGMV